MAGHGSPQSNQYSRPSSQITTRWHQTLSIQSRWWQQLVTCLWVVAFSCAAAYSNAQSSTASSNLRFRVSWGGGQNQSWNGAIETESGQLSHIRPLGLSESSSTTARAIGDREIAIRQTDATNYDGFDFTFDGQLDSRMQINLRAKDGPESQLLETPTIGELIDGTFNRPLDDLGNRITVLRVPGDEIRVEFQQDHLVVPPGALLPVEIWVNHCRLKPSKANLNLSIVNARQSGSPLWSASRPIEIDGSGSSLPKTELQIEVPKSEGVYDLLVDVNQNWLGIQQTTTNPTFRALASPKHSVHRRIQFVVVADRRSEQRPEPDFRTIGEISAEEIQPSGANWRITAYKQKNAILDNQKSTLILKDRQPLIELATGGWQAIRLPTLEMGKPHIVEIDYPTDRPTALGISVLDQSPQGQVALRGADSGIQIPDSVAVGKSEQPLGRHRITFWPKSSDTYLLLANQSTYLTAQFGNVRVFAGPSSLASRSSLQWRQNKLRYDSTAAPEVPLADDAANRKRLAWYQSPTFMDDFGVQKFFDPAVGQPLDDWVAFYEGTSRLIDYLKAHHYQGAMITVTADGSSIYPAALADNTPTHDSGVFLSGGQDPFRKDVLRMMLKMFDRENLTLVPAFSFSHPLEQIESLRDAAQTPQAFDLVDPNQRLAPRSSQRPRYNPLDPNVQQSVTQILDSFLTRYQGFESLGGISLICQPGTYTLLPGSKWGHDRHTADRFLKSIGTAPNGQPDAPSNPSSPLPTDQQWIQWRSDQMTHWYQSIATQLQHHLPGGQLFIAPLGLFQSDEAFSALCPNLHATVNFEQLMRRYGLDKTKLMSDQRIVLLNAQSLPTAETLSASRPEINSIESHRVNAFFAGGSQSGTLFHHQGLWAHFAQLQSLAPFDRQSGRLMRRLQLTPAGLWNRQRLVSAIRHQDSFFLIDGGQGLPQGQEESVANLSATFAQLPQIRFTDVVNSAEGSATMTDQALIVRQASLGGDQYVYAVNDSPWNTTVTIDFSKREPEIRQTSLTQPSEDADRSEIPLRYLPIEGGTPKNAPLQTFDVRSHQLTVHLPPFEIAAGKLIGGQGSATGYVYQVDQTIGQALRKKTYALQAKLNLAKKSIPLNVLANPDFENESTQIDSPSATGWEFGEQTSEEVNFDSTQGYQSRSSLRLASRGSPVWIRSGPFQVPATGRISVTAYLKVDDATQQPPLRISIEGETQSSTYYRFGAVGSLAPENTAKQVDSQWRRFAVHFDDLPVTGIRDLRIGFDLMDQGTVWIDNVHVRDRWFDENDAQAMTQLLAGAVPLADQAGSYESCRRILESYWPRFLDDYIEIGAANSSNNPIAGDASGSRQPNNTDGNLPEDDNVFQRVKSNSPSLLRRWQSNSFQRSVGN